jgi:hypothetical protein
MAADSGPAALNDFLDAGSALEYLPLPRPRDQIDLSLASDPVAIGDQTDGKRPRPDKPDLRNYCTNLKHPGTKLRQWRFMCFSSHRARRRFTPRRILHFREARKKARHNANLANVFK